MARGNFDAYIVKGADNQYKVRPAVAILDNGNKFSICNVSGLVAQVRLEAVHLQNDVDVKTVAVGKKVEFMLKPQGPNDSGKSFSYKVRVETADWQTVPASGESDPVIIIDPPNP